MIKDHPNQHKISHKQCSETRHPIVISMMERSVETETIISEFTKGKKAIVAQILVSENINKSQQAGLRISVWNLSRKVNHLIKVI